MDRNSVFRLLDRELWLVTARADNRRGGLIATFVSQASIAPDMPRILLGLAKQHHTCGLISASSSFAMHLLWPNQLGLVARFALASGHDRDKFEGLQTDATPLGNPLVGSTLAWVDCRVETRLDIGDRILFVGQIEQAEVCGDSLPLTLNHLYHEAPTDMRERLNAMYERDGRRDSAAIRAWQQGR